MSRVEIPNLPSYMVEWVVNDMAELGVKIGNQFFWLYKGESSVIHQHADGTPVRWRPVTRTEFGDVCYPPNVKLKFHPDAVAPGAFYDDDGAEWFPIPKVPLPDPEVILSAN